MAQWNQGSQWGDQRRFTLQDLMVQMRMALSEPHSGSLGTVVYDVDADFGANVTDFDLEGVPEPNRYAVNELALMLNLAQIFTVRDLYDRGFAFPEVTIQEPVRKGMNSVKLPGDFMAIEKIFHYFGKHKREVEETAIKQLEDSYDYTYNVQSSYSSNRLFSFFEVRGNSGDELVSGQVLPEDVLGYDDAIVISEADALKVHVGDFVMNETDGSSTRISNKNSPSGGKVILDLDELMGGRTDTFESLDFFSIQSAAQPYECLNLWPPMLQVKEDTVYQGDPDGWVVEDYTFPTRLRFYVPNRPDKIHPYKSRIYIAVQYDSTPDADTPTFERIAGGSLASEWENGWNEVDLLAEDDFEPNTQYYVRAMTNDFNEEAGTGVEFKPDQIEVFSAARDNYMRITYTRLPYPMLRPDAICELPQYLIDCVLEYAKALAYMKKKDMDAPDASLMAAYEAKIEPALRFLRKRGGSGNKNMFTNPANRSSGYGYRRYGLNYVAPGFTPYVYGLGGR